MRLSLAALVPRVCVAALWPQAAVAGAYALRPYDGGKGLTYPLPRPLAAQKTSKLLKLTGGRATTADRAAGGLIVWTMRRWRRAFWYIQLPPGVGASV